MTTRIKMCGMTRLDDVTYAVQLGVNAIGLIFHEKSSRYVKIADAKLIAKEIPAFVNLVGVFVNASRQTIQQTLAQVPLDYLQFHGDEDPAFCRSFNKPYLKAVHMLEHVDLKKFALDYADAKALLLDSSKAGGSGGGSGKTFDWQQITQHIGKAFFLAGGLNPDNVASAIEQVQPYGVDVSSGVEFEFGIKDHAKMKAFVNAIRKVENHETN